MIQERMQTTRRFEFLDGLRGIAALAVTLLHFHTTIIENSRFTFPYLLEWLFDKGHLGVQIFFVLSGFVIAYSIRRDLVSFPFALRFFLRRSIRLDPPYWAAMGLMILSTLVGNYLFHKAAPFPTFLKFLINAFYLTDLLGIERILPVGWTLCLEIQFYSFFILLIKGIQILNKRTGKSPFDYQSPWALGLFGFFMILSLLYWIPFLALPLLPGLFIASWYSFFTGCLLCWSITGNMQAKWFWAYYSLIAITFITNGDSTLLATLLISLLIYSAAKKEAMHRWLSSWFYQYIGKISYTIYLLHWPVGMKIIDITLRYIPEKLNFLSAMFLMIFTLLMTILASEIFYRCIEFPSLKISHKLKARLATSERVPLITSI